MSKPPRPRDRSGGVAINKRKGVDDMRHRIARFFTSLLLRRNGPTSYGTGTWPPRPQSVPPVTVPGIGMGSCGMPPGVEVRK